MAYGKNTLLASYLFNCADRLAAIATRELTLSTETLCCLVLCREGYPWRHVDSQPKIDEIKRGEVRN